MARRSLHDAKPLLVPGAVLVLAAVVVVVLVDGLWGTAIALGLAGIGLVLLVESAFLAVGRSEDRERAGRGNGQLGGL